MHLPTLLLLLLAIPSNATPSGRNPRAAPSPSPGPISCGLGRPPCPEALTCSLVIELCVPFAAP
ncbi:hypothetical protein BC829DRAFT_400209 [Chytridium lagenaria]|nr:hypothetical protein BC829DRAFT_400209 [Chytridium lagenaria]